MLLDDLQWFDTETLAWLHYLLAPLLTPARMPGMRRACWCSPRCGGRRSTGASRGAAAARATAADQVTELELAPLWAGETAELAARAADRRLDAAAVAAIHRTTEGNPLFVVETVRAGLITAPAPDPRRIPWWRPECRR